MAIENLEVVNFNPFIRASVSTRPCLQLLTLLEYPQQWGTHYHSSPFHGPTPGICQGNMRKLSSGRTKSLLPAVSVDPGPVILGSTQHVGFNSYTRLLLENVNRENMSPFSPMPFLT